MSSPLITRLHLLSPIIISPCVLFDKQINRLCANTHVSRFVDKLNFLSRCNVHDGTDASFLGTLWISVTPPAAVYLLLYSCKAPTKGAAKSCFISPSHLHLLVDWTMTHAEFSFSGSCSAQMLSAPRAVNTEHPVCAQTGYSGSPVCWVWRCVRSNWGVSDE